MATVVGPQLPHPLTRSHSMGFVEPGCWTRRPVGSRSVPVGREWERMALQGAADERKRMAVAQASKTHAMVAKSDGVLQRSAMAASGSGDGGSKVRQQIIPGGTSFPSSTSPAPRPVIGGAGSGFTRAQQQPSPVQVASPALAQPQPPDVSSALLSQTLAGERASAVLSEEAVVVSRPSSPVAAGQPQSLDNGAADQDSVSGDRSSSLLGPQVFAAEAAEQGSVSDGRINPGPDQQSSSTAETGPEFGGRGSPAASPPLPPVAEAAEPASDSSGQTSPAPAQQPPEPVNAARKRGLDPSDPLFTPHVPRAPITVIAGDRSYTDLDPRDRGRTSAACPRPAFDQLLQEWIKAAKNVAARAEGTFTW